MNKEEFIKRYGIDKYNEKLEYSKQHYKENIRKYQERNKTYYQENKENIKEYKSTNPIYRANKLFTDYKRADKEHNRGKCTITSQWIIDNIFNSKCIYCGETDWKKLGCDRIDNNLPHTPDNVVCSCGKCNVERKTTSFQEFIKMKLTT